MNKETFFVTTPIYYINGIPHIGHAYTSIICDVIARYQKIQGKRVKFSTGVDENSQKAILKAQEENMEILPYLDKMAELHKQVWDGFHIEYTDFIRTTEERHHKIVREVLQKTYDRGDIYDGIYEGLYCIGCESFKKDEDLIEKNGKKVCPDHLNEPQKLKEKNYFFRLSKYQTWLKEFYQANPTFVIPQDRFNEVIAFLGRGLEDFSISRETNTFGIKLPFDEEQVTYVWYDALFNYYTVCRNSDKGEDKSEFWPANLQVVGKEILRFHAIYWPVMLASAFGLGEERNGVVHYKESDKNFLPQKILTNGFVMVDGQKISKTIGNVIDPVEFSKKYSKDLMILYMLYCFTIGQDGDFDQKQAILTYNAKLANNLGNLVNRVVVLSLKMGGVLERTKLRRFYGLSIEGDTEEYSEEIYVDIETDKMYEKLDRLILENKDDFENYNLKGVLEKTFIFLDELNNYTTVKEPWKSIKYESKQNETQQILYTIAEGLRQVGIVLYPFFPIKMGEMFTKLGLEHYVERLEKGECKELVQEQEIFHIKEKGEPLFARFEILE